MLVATSIRRSVLAAILIAASVLGMVGVTAASVTSVSQAGPAATATRSAHVAGPDDTPWG
jgi:hypothetical protein